MQISIDKKLSKGFTLLEVLLAMSLTALIGVLAYQGLATAITSMEAQEKEVKRITELQTVWRVIDNDLQQVVRRDITDEEEELRESFLANDKNNDNVLIEFTRSGWSNPLEQHRSDLQRIRYRFENNQLWREHWPTIDRIEKSEPVSLLLIDAVSDVKLGFYVRKTQSSEEGSWIDQWPEETLDMESSELTSNDSKNKTETQAKLEELANSDVVDVEPVFPLAVRITLTTDDWGILERIITLPDGDE